VKPERALEAAKPSTASGVSNLRPSRAQVTEPPYTRSVRTVVWEGRAGDRSPYPDPKGKSERQKTNNKYEKGYTSNELREGNF